MVYIPVVDIQTITENINQLKNNYLMKMIKSFAFAILTTIIFSTSAMAMTTPEATTIEKQQLRSEVLKYIQQSDHQEVETKARISFMVNSENELVVLKVNTADANVERLMKRELNYKKVKTQLSQKNQIYHIDVTFNIE